MCKNKKQVIVKIVLVIYNMKIFLVINKILSVIYNMNSLWIQRAIEVDNES